MARWLKKGRDATQIAEDDAKVRAIVEAILADIASRGDLAVRELSIKYDGWDRPSYRLTARDTGLPRTSPRNLADIEFAQVQIRNFAQHQRDSLKDIEVETLPGVVLGHKKLPVNAAGCYVPAANILCSRRPTCRW